MIPGHSLYADKLLYMATNVGIFPFTVASPATTLQQFRVLTNDTNPTQIGSGSTGTYLYTSDDEANVLLGIYGDNPRFAAARELENIAVSEALMRSWSSDDLSVNGDKVAEALRKLAAQLRAEVAAGVALEDDFEIVSTGTTSFPFADGEWTYEAELVYPYYNPLRYTD